MDLFLALLAVAVQKMKIRLSAIDSMKKKEQHRRIEVKLNDDIAVKEGMVCGGCMDVWIKTQNV